MTDIDPRDFIITQKRKRYKFAWFAKLASCYELAEWKAVVASSQSPLIVELGAGTAYFAVEQARLFPDSQVIAVDVKADRLQAGARRALEIGITNIVFVRARADQLHEVVGDQPVSQLWLTFSDPFPRDRQAKHRLTHPKFLSTYVRCLGDGGRLCIKTDNHPLFDWSLEQLVAQKWCIEALSYDLHESDAPSNVRFQTTFEARFVAQGLPIYYCEATCVRAQASTSPAPITTTSAPLA